MIELIIMSKNKVAMTAVGGLLFLAGLLTRTGITYQIAFNLVFGIFIIVAIPLIVKRIKDLYGGDNILIPFFYGIGIIYFIGLVISFFLPSS
jgi:hypothetical protein